MRRTAAVAALLVLVLAVSGSWYTAEAQGVSELAGAWIITSWENANGEVNSEPQRGLFVFTATGNYSIMYVRGDEPRAEWTEEAPTDAERLAAFDSIVANSGRYTVEGNEISYEAYMALNPSYMAGFNAQSRANAQTITFSIEDGILTLHMTRVNGDAVTATLRRPGQPQD